MSNRILFPDVTNSFYCISSVALIPGKRWQVQTAKIFHISQSRPWCSFDYDVGELHSTFLSKYDHQLMLFYYYKIHTKCQSVGG